MNKNIFLILFVCTTSIMVAQQKLKVGNNTTTINSSAALEIESTTKGFLPPRMTSTQRTAIAAPATGLQVYCTDCSPVGLYSYNGTAWTPVGSLSGASLDNGKILVGSASNVAAAVTPSGDVTIDNNGVSTIGTAKVTTAHLLDATIATADIANSAVTYAKIQNAAANTILGNGTATTGVVQEIATTGTGNVVRAIAPALTGDATATTAAAGDNDTSIATTAFVTSSVSTAVTSATPDASSSVKGKIQLAGDLAGTGSTAVAPIITDAAITAPKLATDAVETIKVKDLNITTAKLADAAVTTAKIASGGNSKVLVSNTTGVVEWKDASSFETIADATTIEGNGTTATPFKVKDAGIVTAKLADNTVTTAKIVNANVTYSKIQNAAANTILGNGTATTGVVQEIATTGTGNVVRAIAPVLTGDATATTAAAGDNDTSIATTAFVTTAVTTATPNATSSATGKIQLAGDLIGTATIPRIAYGAIDALKLADGAITASKLTDDIVTSARIVDATIATADIANSAVTYAKIQNAAANTILGNGTATAGVVQEIATTGTGNVVRATSPTLVTPALGTPVSGVLTNTTGLPLTTGVTGVLPVANGGTGLATITANKLFKGSGTAAMVETGIIEDASGNVGIGATSPTSKLDVAGNAVLSGNSGYKSLYFNSPTENSSIRYAKIGKNFDDPYDLSIWASTVDGAENSVPTVFYSSLNTERMRIDADGNVGIGVIPSAWDAGYKVIQLSGGQSTALVGASNQTELLTNAYYGSGAWRYIGSSVAASRYSQQSGAHYWFNAPSGAAGDPINFTQAMTLDASGNVGIGTSSLSISGGSRKALTLNSLSGQLAIYELAVNGSLTGYLYSDNSQTNLTSVGVNNPLTFGVNGAERMRIDASGNIIYGTSTFGGVGGISMGTLSNGANTSGYISYNSSTSTSYPSIYKFNGDQVGAISYNSTSVTYGTTSDYRLKKNVTPIENALDKVLQLKPSHYKWKVDNTDGEGFIAHELQAIVPYAVTGKKDAVNEDGSIKAQVVDYSKLTPILTKAIQEQQAIIEAQKKDIDDLKAQIQQILSLLNNK
jgi:hypothetical protein